MPRFFPIPIVIGLLAILFSACTAVRGLGVRDSDTLKCPSADKRQNILDNILENSLVDGVFFPWLCTYFNNGGLCTFFANGTADVARSPGVACPDFLSGVTTTTIPTLSTTTTPASSRPNGSPPAAISSGQENPTSLSVVTSFFTIIAPTETTTIFLPTASRPVATQPTSPKSVRSAITAAAVIASIGGVALLGGIGLAVRERRRVVNQRVVDEEMREDLGRQH
ncbi:hypothetical protein C8R46DRAFT_1037574 [Mycena filopes]|nr:hypothetical protein C8R46DRAFT_1037574 [Mycena filopes]